MMIMIISEASRLEMYNFFPIWWNHSKQLSKRNTEMYIFYMITVFSLGISHTVMSTFISNVKALSGLDLAHIETTLQITFYFQSNQ